MATATIKNSLVLAHLTVKGDEVGDFAEMVEERFREGGGMWISSAEDNLSFWVGPGTDIRIHYDENPNDSESGPISVKADLPES